MMKSCTAATAAATGNHYLSIKIAHFLNSHHHFRLNVLLIHHVGQLDADVPQPLGVLLVHRVGKHSFYSFAIAN